MKIKNLQNGCAGVLGVAHDKSDSLLANIHRKGWTLMVREWTLEIMQIGYGGALGIVDGSIANESVCIYMKTVSRTFEVKSSDFKELSA